MKSRKDAHGIDTIRVLKKPGGLLVLEPISTIVAAWRTPPPRAGRVRLLTVQEIGNDNPFISLTATLRRAYTFYALEPST